MKNQLMRRISDSKMDLIKKKFIAKNGKLLKDFDYELDDKRWGIDNTLNSKKRRLDTESKDDNEPPRKKSRVIPNTLVNNAAKSIAEKFDIIWLMMNRL